MLPVMSRSEEPHDSIDPDRIDQRVVLHDVSWDDYERLLALRGESSRPRMTYLEGELELMSPSNDHEEQKKTLARLIEAWADARGVPLIGIGSWTLKKRRKRRGLEPDECYRVGEHRDRDEYPDIAIEVIWTSGGLSKLEVYRKLGIREVWFWKRGRLRFHLLRGEKYVVAERSEVLPDFDPALIERCMSAPSQLAALAALREELRTGG